MNSQYVPSLRAVLIVLMAGTLLSQALLPGLAHELGGPYEETAHLVVPYAVVGIVVIACVQVALVMVWRLLSLIADDTIFTERALPWVDAITVCGAAAASLTAAVAFHLLVIIGVGGPAFLFLLAASVVGGVAFLLLMAHMRNLLRAAITQRVELDQVI